jgi:uncharacterized protein YecE (DUF72 family)
MKLYAGTSGFAYKPWKGPFYPEKLAAAKMLGYYAEHLPAVEINNTFYRLPAASVLENWRAQVPDEFRFVLKASRRITHQKRLKEAEEPLAYLLQNASALGQTLGAVLFQLPPYLRKDVPRLRDFLALLPPDTAATFEFRHNSWFDDEVFTSLSDAGAALCLADTEREEQAPPWVATTDWGYLRLRRPGYDEQSIADWATRIGGEAWEHAFVFFKHEDEGAAPRLAMSLIDLAGRD